MRQASSCSDLPPPCHRFILDCPPVVARIQPPSTQGTGAYEVVDGDTIRASYGVKYRLSGFDAPESFQAQCDAESALGRRATEQLKELLASSEVRVIESGTKVGLGNGGP